LLIPKASRITTPFYTPKQVPGWQQSQNPEPDFEKNFPIYILRIIIKKEKRFDLSQKT
jgi:hypothetical protein